MTLNLKSRLAILPQRLTRSVSGLALSFAGIVVCGLGSYGTAAHAETLQEALISAYQNNPGLKGERARVKEADENFIQARAQGRLTSSFTGTVGAQALRSPDSGLFGPSDGSSITTSRPRSGSLQIIQPIYQGGRVNALKRQANFGVLSARQTLRNSEQNLLVSVATAYVDVIRDEETARIRRNNVSVLARLEQAARDRFDVGEGTRTDIAQAQSRVADANIGLAQADAQLETSRAAYERAVGHPPVDLQPVPEFVLPGTLVEAQNIGVINNPQILTLRLNREAALAGRDIAASTGKPTLSIVGSLDSQRAQISTIGSVDSASLTAQLVIPFYSGGANKSSVRQALNTVERLTYEERDVENAIKQTVRQTWAELDAARRSVVAARQQVEAAEVAFEGVTLEQQVGTRDTLDVLNAEQELLNAKLTVVSAERTVDATVYQLLSVLGGFDADSISLPVDLYDPRDNFDEIKNDGYKRALDRFTPLAIKKIGPQLPDIPKDIYKYSTNNKVADKVEDFGEGMLRLGGLIGDATKGAVDIVTLQTLEEARLREESLNPPERVDVEPIMLSAPDWEIPPTSVSSTLDSSEN